MFKFLEAQGEEHLQAYFLEISKNQEKHILGLIGEKGFAGMYEYWSKIDEEENCDLDLELQRRAVRARACTSARASPRPRTTMPRPLERYCDHCAGWIGPIMDKTGYHLVYDVIDRNKPQCVLRIFKDAEKAREAEKDVRLLMGWPGRKTG